MQMERIAVMALDVVHHVLVDESLRVVTTSEGFISIGIAPPARRD